MRSHVIRVTETMSSTPACWAYGIPPGDYVFKPEFERMYEESKRAIDEVYEQMFGEGSP